MIILRRLQWTTALDDYMKKSLRCGNTLSRIVVERFSSPVGAMYAALPQDLEIEGLTRFEHGGICSVGESHALLVKEIQTYLQRQNAIVILEDSLRRSNDPATRSNRHRLNVLTDVEEVYYYLTTSDIADERKISATCRSASDSSATSFVGLFAGLESSSTIDLAIASFRENVDQLLAEINTIVIGAFDRESFLLWRINEA